MPIALAHRSHSIIAVASLAVAASVAFSVALALPPGPAPTPNVVQGTVRTVDGRAVPGATIRIAGATGAGRGTTIRTTTDASGNYRVRVPMGHYNVDGFADIEYEGQTYKELWLDRGDAPCERVMSDKGIVRNFTLRLSGPKRCTNGFDPNNPGSYNGAYITAMTSEFPDDAVITFNFTPLGPLADGRAGRPLTITRTGAALKKGGGPIRETAFLHDIPLGRYRVAAQVRYASGETEATTLELRDGGDTSGSTLDIAFHANVFGGGIRPVGLGVIPGAPADAAETPAEPQAPEPQAPEPQVAEPEAQPAPDAAENTDAVPAPAPEPEAAPTTDPAPPAPEPAVARRAELPRGRYSCSYRSQYAGDIPTGNSITIMAGGRYQAYGSSGTYTFDPGSETVQWTGPLGEGDVQATFGKRNDMPAITVVGGGASDDPDRTNICVRTGS